MKTIVLIFIFSLFCSVTSAQRLMINQEAGKLFLQHEVLAKQNWYTIGRMYNISPKEIAPFNGTSIDKMLSIGQALKIPLTENNFAQEGQPENNEVFVPLYHTVKEKEGLYRISSQYNKVDQKSLKSWNNLKSADLVKGNDIIVGYLRVKKKVSPLASENIASIPENAKSKSDTIPARTNETAKKTNTDINQSIPNKVINETSIVSATRDMQEAPGTDGFFASAFDEQTRNGKSNTVSGTASIFRSTSGWKDGKYYVLMNNVPPGTIIKVMSASNGRVIYAKVLSELPAIKENEGLLIRISNAAAAQLLMNDARFEVSVSY